MGHVEQKSSSQRRPSEHNDSYLNQSMFYYSAGEGEGNQGKEYFFKTTVTWIADEEKLSSFQPAEWTNIFIS